MIKKMDMVSSLGPMEEDMKETGLTENNLEKESMLVKITNVKRVCGLMEKELNGLIMMIDLLISTLH